MYPDMLIDRNDKLKHVSNAYSDTRLLLFNTKYGSKNVLLVQTKSPTPPMRICTYNIQKSIASVQCVP